MAVSIPANPKDEEVDMAPMIDMVFLLLVFFMVSSHQMSQEYKKMPIPVAASAKAPKERTDRIIVSLEADGTLYLGPAIISEEALKEVMKTRNEYAVARLGEEGRLKLFLRAHQQAEHGEVRGVMRMAAEAGIMDIIFAAHEKE